ncbi:MAG: anti-sigma factor family protein [Gemmataceae bacterium]
MLLDRYRQLLTAYVDGELSSRQRRHVARLLRRSQEARQLLQQLQADARALRYLPRPALPADLTAPVLRTIVERRLTPGQRRIAKVSASTSWVGPLASWAAAAAVLLVLGAASYLYFAASLLQPEKTEMAKEEATPSKTTPKSDPLDASIARKETSHSAPRERSVPKLDRPVARNPQELVKHPGHKPKTSIPDKPSTLPKPETALTDRLELFHLKRVPDLLPVIVKVSDLEQESHRKKLLAELHRDSNFRMELPCPNGTKAMQRVQGAARTLHVGLIIDKQAQERIKLKWRTNYVLYLENVTPEELTQFVRRIAAEDRKSAAKKPAEAQIDRLVLARMTAQHRKELSTLLGIDPTTTPPAAKGLLGTDVRKPLSDLTAQQLGNALAGKGGTPRPQAGKPAPKPSQHVALVLAYHHPVRPSPGSDEIKRFLDGRKPTRPGTIRVLLVLRS